MQFSSKDIQLFNEAGIHVEDKNYTKTKQIKINIEDKESYISGNQVLYYAVTSFV